MADEKKIIIYGAPWCADCNRSKKFMDDNEVKYDYINIEEVEGAADEVTRINNGMQSIPTIIMPDGQILVEPSNEVLKKALKL